MTYSTRAITAELSNVTFNFVRIGAAYRPAYATETDVAQWSLQAIAAEGTKSYEALREFQDLGLDVKDLEDGSLALNLKEYVENRRGEERSIDVFQIIDDDIVELDIEQRTTVGNGSKGHVEFYYYPYANGSGVGMTARLAAVVVTDKVDYIPETPAERMKRKFL